MFLNDVQIADLSSKDKPMIHPFEPKRCRMGSLSYGLGYFGYDIRISDTIMVMPNHGGITVDPANPDPNDTNLDSIRYHKYRTEGFEFKPGMLLLASSLETFNIPPDNFGLLCDKSTLARLGIALQNTVSGEPGWSGRLTIEMTNHGPLTIILRSGMPVGQMLFGCGDRPSKTYSGRYQNQEEGTPAKAWRDIDNSPQPGLFDVVDKN